MHRFPARSRSGRRSRLHSWASLSPAVVLAVLERARALGRRGAAASSARERAEGERGAAASVDSPARRTLEIRDAALAAQEPLKSPPVESSGDSDHRG